MENPINITVIGHTLHWYAGLLVNSFQRFIVGLTLAIAALALSADAGTTPGVACAATSLFAAWLSYADNRYAHWAGAACPWLCAASYAFYLLEVL